ncbi:nuclear transport factor 2 family protein [Haliea sp. E17]|uniref:nuclear transport factor 2 family protein n=1 Tax=Haliea sp. E17 TaxID=3401576 RepID=UPI003AB098EE
MAADALQRLTDESDIHRVLTLYAELLDRRDYDGLDAVFTADATTHYEGVGNFDGIAAIKGLMSKVLDQCGPTQHLLGTVRVEVDGDTAQASCYLQAIHVGRGDYASNLHTVWGEYRDRLQRTPQGWRITHRELAGIHAEGDIGLQLD